MQISWNLGTFWCENIRKIENLVIFRRKKMGQWWWLKLFAIFLNFSGVKMSCNYLHITIPMWLSSNEMPDYSICGCNFAENRRRRNSLLRQYIFPTGIIGNCVHCDALKRETSFEEFYIGGEYMDFYIIIHSVVR